MNAASATLALSITICALGCGSSSSSPSASPAHAGSTSMAGSGGAAGSASGAAGLGGVVYGAGGFSTAGGSGGGMIETCSGYFVDVDGTQSACEACGATQCCDEASACEAAPDCAPCIAGAPTNACMSLGQPIATWKALVDCLATAGVTTANGPCTSACDTSGTPVCNPVTNEGCKGGSACDLDSLGVARCLDAGSAAICAACDTMKDEYCAPTLHCLGSGQCARFCCEDQDCGSGRCVSWPLGGGSLGVCIAGVEGDTAVCDAPADSVSMGACGN